MRYQETEIRELERISDLTTITQVIRTFLLREILILKGGQAEQKGFITKVFTDSAKINVRFQEKLPFSALQEITLQKILLKYVELNCRIVEDLGQGEYALNVESIRIAKKNRRSERIKVKKESVFVTNIVYSPERMELNQYTTPNIIREVLEKFESDLDHPKFGKIKVGLFEKGQDQKFSVVKNVKKPFYIRNTADPESYTTTSPKFINYSTYFGTNILSAIRKYKNNFVRSELILPILFEVVKKESVPTGYIWIESKDEIILPEDLPELHSLSDKIMHAIQNSNSIKATGRFQVLDISETGVRLKIHEKNIIDSLSSNQNFKFDIVFKGQAPIPTICNVRWRAMDKRGKLYLGLEFIKGRNNIGTEKSIEKHIQTLRNVLDPSLATQAS